MIKFKIYKKLVLYINNNQLENILKKDYIHNKNKMYNIFRNK